jgi:hypothetical protein
MGKALQVVMVFQFNGIEDTESAKADQIMQELSMDCDRLRVTYAASEVWISDMLIREGAEIGNKEEGI